MYMFTVLCEVRVACVLFHFQDLLTRHKILCAKFLEDNYDKVCILTRNQHPH